MAEETKRYISNDGLNAYGAVINEQQARDNKGNLDDYSASLLAQQQQAVTDINTTKQQAVTTIQDLVNQADVTEAEYEALNPPVTGRRYFIFPSDYAILFDANGGTGTMDAQHFDSGHARNLYASTFTAPEGKVFSKWNTASDGTGTDYTAGASITPSSSFTLYAIWEDA